MTADAKAFTTITTVEPARGSPLKVTDPNKKITETPASIIATDTHASGHL
ncbi:hypothetical protein [Streptomyces asiaticus]